MVLRWTYMRRVHTCKTLCTQSIQRPGQYVINNRLAVPCPIRRKRESCYVTQDDRQREGENFWTQKLSQWAAAAELVWNRIGGFRAAILEIFFVLRM